jgi:type IV pilus assembly protein PilA
LEATADLGHKALMTLETFRFRQERAKSKNRHISSNHRQQRGGLQPDPQGRERAQRHESERKTKSVLREALARASLRANRSSHGCHVGTNGAHHNKQLLTMNSLNSKLQLAMLNRKKGRNLLEKGFTLVELMIVIVIVGILSAVALPNFLSQTDKARGAEGKSLTSDALNEMAVVYNENGSFNIDACTEIGTLLVNESNASANYAFALDTASATACGTATASSGPGTLTVTATGTGPFPSGSGIITIDAATGQTDKDYTGFK